ncbi:MAG: hypothetical protein WDO13_08420 [Verrucomicrobiota bacterium]
MAEKIYTKIPGLGSGRGKLRVALRSRLFRAADHLLIVQSTGYTEDYKRIFFRDIRAVEVRRTQGQIWQAAIALGALLVFGLLNVTVGLPVVLALLFGAPFLVWLLVNIARGPSCDCYVVTNVQTLLVPTPGRINQVPVFVAFLRENVALLEPQEPPTPAAEEQQQTA